ncbi:uncharacterized protein LOC131016399 [Salvia miltiorrhiza]|uniref:uncharacterized protein LOC131016399 n=1 Tax=Salvia miltiorrhiza TaxID=226208 RepID=UPI0025AC31C6|nr:uncharacterized protein LOC131016399 [Salvia miltiorrhiza]
MNTRLCFKITCLSHISTSLMAAFQGKRGIEKQPFQLPDFIAATGIEKIRQAYIEKEDSKKLKQKQRERMQPKMGKMDIDYQVLHDAFFKHQTKPKLILLKPLMLLIFESSRGRNLIGLSTK